MNQRVIEFSELKEKPKEVVAIFVNDNHARFTGVESDRHTKIYILMFIGEKVRSSIVKNFTFLKSVVLEHRFLF